MKMIKKNESIFQLLKELWEATEFTRREDDLIKDYFGVNKHLETKVDIDLSFDPILSGKLFGFFVMFISTSKETINGEIVISYIESNPSLKKAGAVLVYKGRVSQSELNDKEKLMRIFKSIVDSISKADLELLSTKARKVMKRSHLVNFLKELFL